MKAIIFAAGLGTRIQSVSKGKPKALLEVQGKPLLEHSIEYLLQQGVDSVIVNIHHQAEMMLEYIQQSKYRSIISISDEREQLLDTGGGLLKTKPFFASEDNFIAVNVDVMSNLNLKKMLDFHQQNEAIASLAVRHRDTSRYLIFDENKHMIGWQNVKTNELIRHKTVIQERNLAFSGIHILSSRIWKYLEREPDKKFSTTPLYIKLCKTETVNAFIHDDGYWFDVGKPETYQQAQHFFKNLKDK